MQRIIILTFLALVTFWTLNQRPAAATTGDFAKLVDEYFDAYFALNPTSATANGFHTHDAVLGDFTAAGLQAQLALYKKWESQFAKVDAAALSEVDRSDLELLKTSIQANILDHTEIRSFERNPDYYPSALNQAVYVLMKRKFAPLADRLKLVIAREKGIPAALKAGAENLKNPPKIFTEVALEQISGIISFFKKDVPSAFTDVKDAALVAEFQKTNAAAIAALEEYEKFMRTTLLPQSKGDFRLGKELYAKKLLCDELVDIPLDRLLEIGMANLRQNQNALQETLKLIDPKAKPAEVMANMVKDHPAPDKLLQSFRDTLGSLTQFINERHLLTIPSPVLPILQETPPFDRALTFASMDTPGAYEHVSTEAYFNATLPESTWTKERVAEHMEGFNRGTIISTAIHEAYPGHYVQFLWLKRVTSKVRKLLGCNSNCEGWAHYVEQMMLDEGYGGNDPKLRLGQLQDALLRNARYIVGIQMHTGSMTFDQAVDFFVKEGHQSRANGLMEVKRGTSDPTYLYYTLGKLAIYKLRDDYKKLKGKDYKLGEFHDAFLSLGTPHLKFVRRALLKMDGPLL